MTAKHFLLLAPLFGFLGFASGTTVGGWDAKGNFNPIAVDQYGNQGRQFMGPTFQLTSAVGDAVLVLDAGGNYRVLCTTLTWMSGALQNVDGGPLFTDGGCDAGPDKVYDAGGTPADGGPWIGTCYNLDGGNIAIDAGLVAGAFPGTPILPNVPEAYSFGFSVTPVVHAAALDAGYVGTCYLTQLSVNTQ